MEIIIKLDHNEPVKVKTSSTHGEQHPDPNDEITAEQLISRNKSKEDKIQDLKLENDRLMQQNGLMIDYIHALACVESKKSKYYALCEDGNCPYYDHDKGFGKGACKLGSRELIEKEAANIIDKLEDL